MARPFISRQWVGLSKGGCELTPFSRGQVDYLAPDSQGNTMLWRWAASGSGALLNQAVTARLTVTGRVVSAAFDARYTRNAAGEITSRVVKIGNVTHDESYGYDAQGRLVSVTQDGSTTTYGYDANGNRVSVNGVVVGSYNARDQLLRYGADTYSWCYVPPYFHHFIPTYLR